MQKDISQYYRYLIGESNIQDEKINPIFCTKRGCLGASLTLQIPFTIIAISVMLVILDAVIVSRNGTKA